MSRSSVLPLLLGMVLSGCAQQQLAAPVSVAEPVAKPGLEIAKSENVEKLPAIELTEDLLFQFLVSEIAGQRGLVGVAKEGYLDLARKTRDPRIVRRAVEIAVFARDQQAALELANMWNELEPGTLRALQTIVAILVARGQVEATAPYLEKMLQDQQAGAGFMQLPGLFANTRNHQAVLALLRKLVARQPKVAEAHYAHAHAALNAEKHAEALEALKRAEQINPGWEQAAMLRAQVLAKTSRSEALTYLKSYLEAYPEAHDARLAYARMLVANDQFGEAQAQFAQLAAKRPGSEDIALAAGLLALQMGSLEEAESHLSRAVELAREESGFSEDSAAQYYLGQIAEEKQAFELAATRYRAIQTGEYLIPSRTRLALMLARQGEMAKARAELKTVKATNNVQRIQLIQAEADLLREVKDHAAVYELLDMAVRASPDNVDLLYDRAMAAEKLDKLDVLEADLRKVIKLKPDHAHAYNALGYTLVERTTRLNEATELLEKALALSPEDAFILDSVGWLHYRKGNLDKARDYLERAWRLRQDPEIAAHLGEVLWMRGSQDEAAKVWDGALRKHPKNEALLEILRKFKK